MPETLAQHLDNLFNQPHHLEKHRKRYHVPLKHYHVPCKPITLPTTREEIPSHVAHILEKAWAPATRRRYDISVKDFLRFCEDQRIPSLRQLPADEMLLASYAASLAGSISGASIQNRIAAVRAWHIRHNASWNGGTLLDYVLRGTHKASPPSSKSARRPPVTFEMLEQLYQSMGPFSTLDHAVYAAATTMFYGQLRVGEVCATQEKYSTFNNQLHPTLADLRAPHTLAGSRILHLPCTKTKGTQGEDVAICRQDGCTDPINAMRNHMVVNDITDPKIALFSYWDDNIHMRKLLTPSKFMKRCNELWKNWGHPRFTGHSFRIGGTTHYLLRKVDPNVIRVMGRWSSDAFLRYWRQLDVLATIHTERCNRRANSRVSLAFLRRTRKLNAGDLLIRKTQTTRAIFSDRFADHQS